MLVSLHLRGLGEVGILRRHLLVIGIYVNDPPSLVTLRHEVALFSTSVVSAAVVEVVLLVLLLFPSIVLALVLVSEILVVIFLVKVFLALWLVIGLFDVSWDMGLVSGGRLLRNLITQIILLHRHVDFRGFILSIDKIFFI